MRTQYAIELHKKKKKAIKPIRDYLNIQKDIHTPSNVIRGVRYHATNSNREAAIRRYQERVGNVLMNINQMRKTDKYWNKYEIQELLEETIKTLEASSNLLRCMYNTEKVKRERVITDSH